jgi:hypothetical protein
MAKIELCGIINMKALEVDSILRNAETGKSKKFGCKHCAAYIYGEKRASGVKISIDDREKCVMRNKIKEVDPS